MVCETIGRARAGRDPQHARVPLRRFTPCEHRAVILQPVRLSSFTAISISSATRIPQETCWIPQETCFVGQKSTCWIPQETCLLDEKRASLARSCRPCTHFLACWRCARSLFAEPSIHPVCRLNSFVCVCVPGREGLDGYGRRDPTVTSCPRLVSCTCPF